MTNFGKLLFGSIAIAGLLTACNSNDQIQGTVEVESTLNVEFTLPGNASSRSVVENPIIEVTPDIRTVHVSVVRGESNTLAKGTITMAEGETSGSIAFKAIKLGGNETVVITANGEDENTVAQGLSIDKIQPTADKAGLANVFYANKRQLTATDLQTLDGVKTYTVDMSLLPVAARVELFGNIAYSDDVKDLTVNFITPNAYSTNYNVLSTFNSTTATPGSLAIFSTPAVPNSFYADIEDGTKAIANHLFVGDQQNIAFRIKATIYDLYENQNTNDYVKVKVGMDGEEEIYSYVYKTAENDLYVAKYEAGVREYYGITIDEDNQYSISTEKAPSSLILATETREGFFTLSNFKISDTTGGNLGVIINNGKYQAGKIYKINLAEIDWNNDGKFIEGEDEYDPTENGGGTIEPSVKQGLSVNVTVSNWSIDKIIPGVH